MKNATQADNYSSTVVTFKPLKSGKVKCNQTGIIMKSDKSRAYRRMLVNQKMHSAGLLGDKPSILQEVIILYDSSRCPTCRMTNRSSPGKVKCPHCKQSYLAVRKRYIIYSRESAYDRHAKYVTCPKCYDRIKDPRENADNICPYCRTSFYVIPRLTMET